MEQKNYKRLYDEGDLAVMKIAEDSLDPNLDRVDEILAYCKEAGIKKVGIGHCISFKKQAKKLEDVLQVFREYRNNKEKLLQKIEGKS